MQRFALLWQNFRKICWWLIKLSVTPIFFKCRRYWQVAESESDNPWQEQKEGLMGFISLMIINRHCASPHVLVLRNKERQVCRKGFDKKTKRERKKKNRPTRAMTQMLCRVKWVCCSTGWREQSQKRNLGEIERLWAESCPFGRQTAAAAAPSSFL